jgi:hypothetical protein
MRELVIEMNPDSPVILNALGDSVHPGPIPVAFPPGKDAVPGKIILEGINPENGAFIFRVKELGEGEI